MPSLQETSMNPSLQEITEEISHSNPLPGLSERILLENPDFYNVWKGKMYIQGKLVCDIALQSSTNYSIPAQLPEKLEIRDVIRLSDLRQKLPEDIFERLDFSGKEVCCGEVYCSLYQLRASNVVGLELYKLQTLMKDKDLAVVKLLNDQGFLIFITSTLVKASKDLQHSDSSCLAALFLFLTQGYWTVKSLNNGKKTFPLKMSL
ncbi:protein TASOR-like [Bombina bombina]|uniref:protein TASOR-like n=1 Tax=Bombina bombina TaxID=8345 RepID=UPI00235A7D2E|nr:protein TASOR-like [Bombina bombina]XP_053572384.1 protein TASOR-like [Bombina bombina]XP_053572385.1 protein TASOR-like [Bombina bombina]